MKAGRARANAGGPQGLLKRGRGPTSSKAILNKSGESLKSIEAKMPAV